MTRYPGMTTMFQSNKLDTDSSAAVRPMASPISAATDSVRILGVLFTASVGRIDERLDREMKTLEAQVSEWMVAEEANKPKGKRTAGLNVMRT